DDGAPASSLADQSLHDVPNEIPQAAVLDGPRSVALRGPDIDHRVELDTVQPCSLWIQVDAPQVQLTRTVVEKRGLLIGVKLASDGHDVPLNVHHGLHHVPELLAGKFLQFLKRDGPTHDPNIWRHD